MSDITNICKSCPHYKYCKNMCPFAKKYTYVGYKGPIEKFVDDLETGRGLRHQMQPQNRKEVYLSSLSHDRDDGGLSSEHDDIAMHHNAYKVFWDNIDYKNYKCEIIGDVLFNGLTFEEVADKHGHKDAEMSKYLFNRYIRQFAKRISMLEQEETRLKHVESVKERMTKKYGKMSKGLRQFLCFHCLGMTVDEIMDLFGNGRTTIHDALRKYDQHLQNDELRLVRDDDGYIVERSRKVGKPKQKKAA